MSASEQWKIVFHNAMVFIVIITLITLLTLNTILGNWDVLPINLMMILLCGISLFLNHRNYFLFSRLFFIATIIGAITLASFTAYNHNRFTETENILFTAIFIVAILLEGRIKYAFALLILLGIFLMKGIKFNYLGLPLDAGFYSLLLNVGVIGGIIFTFSIAFKNTLQNAALENERQKNTLFTLIDHLPIFIATVDKNWHYVMANARYELFGKSRMEIIGAHVSSVLPESLYIRHEPLIAEAFKGHPQTFIEDTLMPDGRIVQSAGKYIPIFKEGQVDSVTVYAMDISDLRKAEDSLIEANKMKDRLLSIVAHDVKNPLNLFHSLLHIDDEIMLTQSDFRKYKDALKEQLSDLNNQLDQILNWGLSQMEGVKAYPDRVDVESILHENALHFKQLASKKKIKILVDTEQLLFAFVDENHLRIVVRNLLHNALKFSSEGSHIYVTARYLMGAVRVEIRDEGTGMSEESIAQIKQGSVQPSTRGTKGEMGTGLGLSMCVDLLRKNKCNLQIESILGAGSVFTIDLQNEPWGIIGKSPNSEMHSHQKTVGKTG